MTGRCWRPDEDEELTRRWADGESATVIGHRMSRTRNSIIGRVCRLKLPSRPTHVVKSNGGSPAFLRNERNYGNRARRFKAGKPFVLRDSTNRSRAPILPPEPLPPASEYDRARVSFVDLDEDGQKHCHWPVGDPQQAGAFEPLFCGEERVPGTPYCKVHVARSQNPAKPKSIRPNTDVPAMTSRILEPELA